MSRMHVNLELDSEVVKQLKVRAIMADLNLSQYFEKVIVPDFLNPKPEEKPKKRQ